MVRFGLWLVGVRAVEGREVGVRPRDRVHGPSFSPRPRETPEWASNGTALRHVLGSYPSGRCRQSTSTARLRRRPGHAHGAPTGKGRILSACTLAWGCGFRPLFLGVRGRVVGVVSAYLPSRC